MTTTPGAVRSGLTTAEAVRRLDEHGQNAVPEPAPPRLWARALVQLRDPLVLVLLAAMVVTLALRDVADTVVIALVIIVNTTVGLIQEVRADHAVAALRRLAAPTAHVIRDGVRQVIPSEDVVPGDLVLLAAGDVVPADLDLVEAVRLRLDEAALTGESVPVDKAVGGDGEVLAGTVVVNGRGIGVVGRTGTASALGRIAALVAGQPREQTPLQRRLAGLGRTIGVAAVALSALVMLGGIVRGIPLADMILTGVSLVVAAVPESLPAVVTVTLALGARRMARRAAIVRRLPAVETLGSVTVVAADKTGTLTEGTMVCDLLVTVEGTVDLAHAPAEPDLATWRVARDMMLCNDTHLPTDDEHDPVGDPVEVAMMVAGRGLGLSSRIREDYPRVAEVPFDATKRCMTTVHATPEGDYLVVRKGAPEVLLPDGDRFGTTAEDLTRDGYRLLAVAEARHAHLPSATELDDDLLPVGLVALTDPVRDTAPGVVKRFIRAGIRLILITGDHPATAVAVARRVGIPETAGTATGRDLAAGDVPAGVAVFARTRPEQKMDIVHTLKERGDVVAMTGDGVNDAPALRAADIGVAMGGGGTEVARQAADLVLADDNLATLGTAVEEGRRIYTNIRRFLTYGLSGGVAEILVMLVGPFLGLAVPLLPAQILWVNMLTHGLPGVALGAEPVDRDAMNRPPRPPSHAILDRVLAGRVVSVAVLITATTLGVAVWAAATGRPWQTMLFVVLGVGQLGVALSVRAHRAPGIGLNWSLFAAVASSLVLQLAAVTLEPLRTLLGTVPLTGADLATCLAVAVVPGLLLGAERAISSRVTQRRTVVTEIAQ